MSSCRMSLCNLYAECLYAKCHYVEWHCACCFHVIMLNVSTQRGQKNQAFNSFSVVVKEFMMFPVEGAGGLVDWVPLKKELVVV